MIATARPGFQRALQSAFAILVLALGVVALPGVAAAHTDFDSSTPADLDTVDGPLDEIVVRFTNPAEPAGEGFEVLGPDGTLVAPAALDPTDGTAFVLRFDPALDAGTYGVRWNVRAGDAHPIDGSFRFEIIEPAPVTTEPAAPATTVPTPAAGAPATTPSTTPTTPSSTPVADESAALEAFLLDDGGSQDSLTLGRIGHGLAFAGTIFGIGVVAALVWVIRGPRHELLNLVNWVRLAAITIAAGGVIELAALQATASSGLADTLTSRPGVATAFKIVGGLAAWFGFHERAGNLVAPAHSLSAAVATDVESARPGDRHDALRWTPTTAVAAGFVGYALVLASFWFDGHTVSKGPWALHSLANLAHLGAAAVWGGGVFAMTAVAWMRRRRSVRAGLAEMVIRFSGIATVSLATVIAAGVLMTILILDQPGDLVSTDWGRVLIAKTSVVAVAAAIGGFNHFRLRPALEATPDDPSLLRHLRVSLTVESVAFAAVIVLTAILVASAT